MSRLAAGALAAWLALPLVLGALLIGLYVARRRASSGAGRRAGMHHRRSRGRAIRRHRVAGPRRGTRRPAMPPLGVQQDGARWPVLAPEYRRDVIRQEWVNFR